MLRIPCNFLLIKIIIFSYGKCVNIPVRSPKIPFYPGASPPGPPLMFRPAPIRGLKAALKTLALLVLGVHIKTTLATTNSYKKIKFTNISIHLT